MVSAEICGASASRAYGRAGNSIAISVSIWGGARIGFAEARTILTRLALPAVLDEERGSGCSGTYRHSGTGTPGGAGHEGHAAVRSEERRVGKKCVSLSGSRLSRYHKKKNQNQTISL